MVDEGEANLRRVGRRAGFEGRETNCDAVIFNRNAMVR